MSLGPSTVGLAYPLGANALGSKGIHVCYFSNDHRGGLACSQSLSGSGFIKFVRSDSLNACMLGPGARH